MKVVLTIAGTDPSGAAGIQADLQTIRDHGCHGVSVITAVLAQNTQGVRELLPMPAAFVAQQLDAVFDDFDVAAMKIGLVPNDEVLAVVASRLGGRPAVWDPVIHSGDGATPLFSGSAVNLFMAARRADVVTPNIPEIEHFTAVKAETRELARAGAEALSYHGPSVLLKVGHLGVEARRMAAEDPRTLLPPEALSDIWAENGRSTDLAPLLAIAEDVRGTGCQLSAALACNLTKGITRREAAEAARAYLNEVLITHAAHLGRGRMLVVR